MSKLDEFLPVYQFNEIYAVSIRSSRSEAYDALKSVRLADLSVFAPWLLALRALPARLVGNHRAELRELSSTLPLLEAMSRNGFVRLADLPDREIVIGIIGQPWKITSVEEPILRDAEAFLSFDQPDYALIATDFRIVVDEEPGRVGCTTETRVHIPDAKARGQFSRYWRFAGIGSGLLRRMWLNAIRTRAEASSRNRKWNVNA
jgi:hypothetical protein